MNPRCHVLICDRVKLVVCSKCSISQLDNFVPRPPMMMMHGNSTFTQIFPTSSTVGLKARSHSARSAVRRAASRSPLAARRAGEQLNARRAATRPKSKTWISYVAFTQSAVGDGRNRSRPLPKSKLARLWERPRAVPYVTARSATNKQACSC